MVCQCMSRYSMPDTKYTKFRSFQALGCQGAPWTGQPQVRSKEGLDLRITESTGALGSSNFAYKKESCDSHVFSSVHALLHDPNFWFCCPCVMVIWLWYLCFALVNTLESAVFLCLMLQTVLGSMKVCSHHLHVVGVDVVSTSKHSQSAAHSNISRYIRYIQIYPRIRWNDME